MRFPTPLLVLLATTLGGLLQAQDTPTKIVTSFYCFRYADQLKDIYVRTGPQTYQLVELSTANIVGPLAAVSANGDITLHHKVVNDKGDETYPLVGRAKTGTIRKPLVVLFPGPKKDKLPYRALTIDRNDTKFPLGSYQFINLSPHAIRGLIGKTPLQSKPGSVTNLRPQGAPGEMMNVVFEYQDGKQWRTMTKTRWALRPNRRSLLCAYLDLRDHRIKMRSIPERLVPANAP